MSTAPLRAISPVPSSVLSALTQDTIPRLETLHELERHVRKYRDAHQSRITHCKELEDAVDESYSSLNDKDKDRNRPKSLKKGEHSHLIILFFIVLFLGLTYYNATRLCIS
jgi:hypothetical protein